MPLALLEVEAPVPSRVFLDERPFFGVVGVVPHHLVGHGLNFLAGNEAREDRPLVDYPADADHDGRHRDRNRQPLHANPEPFQEITRQEHFVHIDDNISFVDVKQVIGTICSYATIRDESTP